MIDTHTTHHTLTHYTAYATPPTRASDETDILVDAAAPIGLLLRDVRVFLDPTKRTAGSARVAVADVVPASQADQLGIHIDDIIVAINGVSVERETSEQITARLSAARGGAAAGLVAPPLVLRVKDPSRFLNRLTDPLPEGVDEIRESTALTPGDAAGEQAQIFGARRRNVPSPCTRPAAEGDLLEIAYEGRVASTGALFDGMELATRQGDSTIQFVLGRQPGGQFPPAWDVGLVGMCVGEERELDVPPVLGYGSKGMPKRGIPPDATLLYRIELVSINAITKP